MICINVNVAGYFHGFAGDVLKAEPFRAVQGFCGGHGIIAAGTDAYDAVVRFHDFSGAGDNQRNVTVSDNHKGLQLPQVFVHAPVFGQLDRGALELVGMFFKFSFQTFNQRNAVGSRAGKSGDDFAVADAADFDRF